MSNLDFKSLLQQAENKFPVSTWKIDDLDIWPFIRTKIGSICALTERKLLAHQKKKFDSKTSIKKLAFISWLRSMFIKKADIVFVTASSHRQGEYNKFFDPIADTLTHQEFYLLESSRVDEYNLSDIHQPQRVFLVHSLIYFYELKEVIFKKLKLAKKSKSPKLQLDKYDDFIEFLKQNKFSEKVTEAISEKELLKFYQTFKKNEIQYNKLLTKLKPKALFVVCYYSFPSFVATYAAKKLKIKTIEIQHGPVKSHHAYEDWQNIPENGYNLIPDRFWTWDENSKKVLETIAINKDYVVNGGNIWNDYQMHINQEKAGNRSVILYSMQGFDAEKAFPDYLITAMKRTSAKWILRLHPRYTGLEKQYKAKLDNEKVHPSLYQFDSGKDTSLMELIKTSLINITFSSGCTIECANFGIPSILLDENGSEMYASYFKENFVEFVNYSNFEDQIQRLIDLNKDIQVQKETTLNYQDTLIKLGILNG